jgi:ADP-ribose pyrophosphatase YjhB (NUDIX family)
MVYEQIADQAYREWQESTRLQLGQLLAPAQTEERPGPGSKRLTYISHYHAFANMNEVTHNTRQERKRIERKES